MVLIYINPSVNMIVYLGIAILAVAVTFYALIAGREKLEEDEAKDNVRLVERRILN